MGEKKSETRSSRRDFLRLAGLGATAGAVAAATGASTGEAEAAEAPASSGYRESAHVKRYYELASF